MSALFGAFGIKVPLLLAQAVNFSLVLMALGYFLYKPLAKVLAERQEIVTKGVEDALAISSKLSSADAEATKRVNAADSSADTIIQNSRTEASAERARVVRDAETRAAQIAKDAEDRARESTDRARRESEKEVARLAILAAEKILATNA